MSHSSLSSLYNALEHMQRIWEWLYLEKCFFTKSARRQRTCMYERIVWDISLIFNEFKDAPLWFLCNHYTARIRVIGVNLDQGKRKLVRVSEKFELSKGEWAEKKWLKNPREMVSVRSEFKLSEFELHWGSRAVLKYFFEFISNWSVKKNKIPPHGNNNS